MELKVSKCPICGQSRPLVPTNNPLVPPICVNCIYERVDADNLEEVDFFCRTVNVPFRPDLWIKMRKEFKQNVFKEYLGFFYDDKAEVYEDTNKNIWKKANDEWNLVRTHNEIVAKIEPIKEGFMLRNQIKWGMNYTFQELISLENLFVNTLEANNVSNPMQKDAIKKACKMSVALDKAITSGDSKEINELSKAYQNFVKTAKIDDLITESSKDVISNVAQLVQYIEDQGFEFQFYDGVDRDIVDKSLKDMQQFIQRLVTDSTGLDVVFDTINSALKREDAIKKDAESYEKTSLEDLYEAGLQARNEEFDTELEEEGEEDIEDEDDGFF